MWLLLLACERPTEAGCENGLDLNEDGVCDNAAADWSADARLPSEGDRHNIYDLSEADLEATTEIGLNFAAVWPVDVSGMLMPADSFQRFFEENSTDSRRLAYQDLARRGLGFGTLSEMYAWLGLASYPEDGSVPIPEGMVAGDPMGVGTPETAWGPALTFSCYACHATNFYGHVVVGLTNRRARANEYFHLASQFFPLLTSEAWQEATDATAEEVSLFERSQANLPAVGSKVPIVRGLDTSLAQVALSLARRDADAWATRDASWEASPRPSALDETVSDSKPAVWWALKYKTHWLTDGSIRSGNPVFTNFLWNELGRGTDLHDLDGWMKANGEAIDALTVAVFNTPSPRWKDIFPQFPLDIAKAQAGEGIYADRCASCHGDYLKNWDDPNDPSLTLHLDYSPQTVAIEVGTDPQRAEGMSAFADALNALQISKNMGTIVEVQQGYVPPPLDAVWARFPYLHNGSVPSLCALLQPASRPAQFYVGPPDSVDTDFDADCVGLPVNPPEDWKSDPKNLVDTQIAGLGNQGHSEMMEGLSAEEQGQLIEFLKTL